MVFPTTLRFLRPSSDLWRKNSRPAYSCIFHLLHFIPSSLFPSFPSFISSLSLYLTTTLISPSPPLTERRTALFLYLLSLSPPYSLPGISPAVEVGRTHFLSVSVDIFYSNVPILGPCTGRPLPLVVLDPCARLDWLLCLESSEFRWHNHPRTRVAGRQAG